MERARQIGHVRREYNQWVANETLEDYALRFTAKSARKWSPFRVANTAIGGISFLALEAIGGAITLTYGFTNAFWAIIAVGTILFLLGLPVSVYAARFGVDIDLLTRGAGFGYLGSTITSLIYASFTFIFFAIEAAIMAKALDMCFGIPEAIGFILSSLVVIPLVTHGFKLISQFQLVTQPLWIILHVLPFAILALNDDGTFSAWMAFTGRIGHVDGRFDILLFGAASSIVFSLVAQVGEQVDFLRFLPKPGAQKADNRKWWVALIASGPGWIVLGTLKLLAGSFLAYLAFRSGVPPADAAEPTHMYQVAFTRLTENPATGLFLAALFVIISQLKINVTNAYAGSIAWSNFFSRLTHSHPGRVVWVMFNVVFALLLMELGVYRALEKILGLYSHVAVAWMGAIVADLVISKPLGLSPAGIEFKRAHLYDINPAGLGSMLGASALSIAAYFGLFGETAAALSAYIALLTALVLAPVIALMTRGRYYLARQPAQELKQRPSYTCEVCVNVFETEDMAHCPVHQGPICSLCCTLNARCRDQCKEKSRAGDQLALFLDYCGVSNWRSALTSNVAQYFALLFAVCAIIGTVLALVYWQSITELRPLKEALAVALLKSFFGLLLIAGVVAWLFVLAHESREIAQQEIERQTGLLTAEIAAHEETDKQLQVAKEVAESANLAKSRYLVGISHEFRTPLNAILGYAQLIERGELSSKREQSAVRTIRRSAEHLAGLVDGLLDVARIEAGRFELARDEFEFPDFIAQVADMFRLQAESKGISFRFELSKALPARVRCDEKRLRQILINLLSNGVKFTEKGEVKFVVSSRNNVATFVVEDTGIGIAPENLKRIFVPFERIENRDGAWVPGTGLGLTLTKLMTEMMGGAIDVQSEFGKGSRFSVRIYLPSLPRLEPKPTTARKVMAYEGPRRRIMIVDDDEVQRRLVSDMLNPLGFAIETAESAAECLERTRLSTPDIFLLDVTMPEIDGWTLARRLRSERGGDVVIVMMSAMAGSELASQAKDACHNGFVVKPFEIEHLLTVIGDAARLQWIRSPLDSERTSSSSSSTSKSEKSELLTELGRLAQLGLLHPLGRQLEAARSELPEELYHRLARLFDSLELGQFATELGMFLNEPEQA